MNTIASSLSPTAKDRLRPYWYAWGRVREMATASLLALRIGARQARQAFATVRIPAAANGRLNLHLGCGPVAHPEFVNIDGHPYAHVDFVQSIERLHRFKRGTVDLIYASHCLEHVGFRKTVTVLTEWHRVLKTGGVLRLSVPDFDQLIAVYAHHGRDPDLIIGPLMGGQDSRYNVHYTALSEVNLTRALRAAGFATVRHWQPGSEPLATFDDYSVYRMEVDGCSHEISLNLEAVK